MGLSRTERKTYQVRLARLEHILERVEAELIAAAGSDDPGLARRLHERLETTEIEIELLRELLEKEGSS